MYVPGLLLLTVLISTSCSHAPDPTRAAAAPPTQPTPAASPPAPTDDHYTASGPIVVENQVDVAAQRGGVVTEIFVEPGTRVRKGQLLAKLDDRQVVADLKRPAPRPPAPKRISIIGRRKPRFSSQTCNAPAKCGMPSSSRRNNLSTRSSKPRLTSGTSNASNSCSSMRVISSDLWSWNWRKHRSRRLSMGSSRVDMF